MEYAEVGKFNKIVAMVFGSDSPSEVDNAINLGKQFLKSRQTAITDFKLILAGSQPSQINGSGHWERLVKRLFRDLDAKDSALQSARAETDTVRRERDELRAKLKTRVAAKPAKAEADTLRAKVAKLEATLAKTMAESDESNRARDEADARADAARRENDELRAALQEATAELREAHRVADVRRDAMSHNARADAAGAATDNPTSGVEAHEHHAETVENPTCTHSSDDVASDRQQGWNPRFDAKAVGLYWRAVHAINADLEAGLITKKQASGRKASALRDYKSGAKLGNRARPARRAA